MHVIMWHLMSISTEDDKPVAHDAPRVTVSGGWTMILNFAVEVLLQGKLLSWSCALIQSCGKHTGLICMIERIVSNGHALLSWGLLSLVISVKNGTSVLDQKGVLESYRSWTVKFNGCIIRILTGILKLWFLFDISGLCFLNCQAFLTSSSDWTWIISHRFV